eukprot:CAMPEP_0194595232 /NCGR_PEP_ID=MMETSP0292-20121207/24821_1 /TAXON_ID=39354 /ORGANISM="Heterosigma akashiwo, Strain CCMP2393" /LENGTH=63 /DNA_ID=CAMNT_0039455023 /DNA_START=471 /DNA_END=659 /DNA_ORIENTATION=-
MTPEAVFALACTPTAVVDSLNCGSSALLATGSACLCSSWLSRPRACGSRYFSRPSQSYSECAQ